jgi:hypothetical protein
MVFSALATATISDDWRQLLEDLYQGRNVTTIKSGQFITMQSHEVLIVCRGVVQLSTLYPNGDEGIIGLICPSMPFGPPLSQMTPYEAIALTDVVLMRVHIMEIEQSPRLAQSLFKELIRRLSPRRRPTPAAIRTAPPRNWASNPPRDSAERSPDPSANCRLDWYHQGHHYSTA